MTEIDVEAVREEIIREIVALHEENYGAGATNTEVHVLENVVLVIVDIELTQAEQTLIADGHAREVKGMREAFQRAIGPTFRAVVERATGRTVNDFLSAVQTDPLYSVELFRLDPAG